MIERSAVRSAALGLGILAILASGAYVAKLAYTIVRYQVHVWLPDYVASAFDSRESSTGEGRHLIFLMVDHFEPGKGEDADERASRWVSKLRPIADRHRDASGRRFQYTWFYAVDEHREGVLATLARASREGYGEVELHWHHPPSDSDRFPQMLDEALSWFRRYGVGVSGNSEGRTQFGFIHGLWALDGSQPRCGVNRELDILFRSGCYADFTFSTAGTVSQPRKVNAIYYATDTDAPKSYDDGEDVRVGRKVDDRLMIFQGPIGFDWMRARLDYAAVENYAPPTPARISRWIDADIHVKGRPEWVFVKVYSHGIPSEPVILDRHLDRMLSDLEEICRRRGIALHYMTAREAFNVVKAAEDGGRGDPGSFRDYRLPPPACSAAPDAGAPELATRSGEAAGGPVTDARR